MYETYYDISYPNHERGPGGRCACRSANALACGSGRRLRREVRLGAGELVRAQRGGGRRVAAPTRLGGAALVAGGGRRGAAARGCGHVRRELVLQVRGQGPGAPTCSSACATTGRPAVGSDHLHTDAEIRGGIECDFTVARLARSGSRSSPARHSGTTTWAGCAGMCPATERAGAGRHLGSGLLRNLGPARARDPAPADRERLSTADFPYLSVARSPSGMCPSGRYG